MTMGGVPQPLCRLLPPKHFSASPPSPLKRSSASMSALLRSAAPAKKAAPVSGVLKIEPFAAPSRALYWHSERLIFGEAAARERRDPDDLAPTEISTKVSTIDFGLQQSARTIEECEAILCGERWKSWSNKDRELRNKLAGKPQLGT